MILKTKKRKGHGKVKDQRKRRRLAHRIIDPQPYLYELIDGNFSRYIVGYCNFKQGYLTYGLAEVHNCWKCRRFCEN